MSLGERVAWLRRLSNLSVKELVSRANADMDEGTLLKESTVSNIESGRKKDVSLSELMGLSWGLDMPPGLIMADFLEPFALSGVEPFRSLGTTNEGVLTMFPITTRWNRGLTAEAAALITDGITVALALSDMWNICSSSLALRDEFRVLTEYVDARESLQMAYGHVDSVWHGQGETVDLLFAVRVDRLRQRYRTALNTISGVRRMHGRKRGLLDKSQKERFKATFAWADECGLPTDMEVVHRELERIVGIADYWEDLSVDSPYAAIALRNSLTGLLAGLDLRQYSNVALRTEVQTYLAISCVLAEVDDRPEITRGVDFAKINAQLGYAISWYNLAPLGTRRAGDPTISQASRTMANGFLAYERSAVHKP